MAVSRRDLRALLGKVEQDLARPVAAAGSAAILPFKRERGRPDIAFENLTATLEQDTGILWAEMHHLERACFTRPLMRDGREFQLYLKRLYQGASPEEMPFRYLAWVSRAKGAWSLGGDLSVFTALIRAKDREGLRAYAHLSIDVLHDNYCGLELPIITAAVIEGDAVGGGFEAMLTNDFVVAERGAKFGLPEILFNLFPGMGAYSFLRRRVGEVEARRLIEDGRTRSADELHQLGLVDIVCEKGEGRDRLREHVRANPRRFRTELALRRMRNRVEPVTKSELVDIVELWVDLALTLEEQDLRRMDCLARHQQRRRASA